MLSNDELQQIAQIVREELKPINERLDKVDEQLDKIKEDIDIIKEDTAAALYSSSELVRWVDTNFRHKYPFPIDRDIG